MQSLLPENCPTSKIEASPAAGNVTVGAVANVLVPVYPADTVSAEDDGTVSGTAGSAVRMIPAA